MKLMTYLIAASVLALGSAFAQENYTQWTRSKTYTLNTSASGANVAADVRDFPVLVRLGAADSAVFLGAKTGGADLRFAKANGKRLPHQRDSWDSAGRSAAFWVLLDTVKGNSTTQALHLYWGKSDAMDSSKGSSVFDTTSGYVGVWHMDSTGNVPDATINGLTGVEVNSVPSAAGIVGNARSFNSSLADGGTARFIAVAHDARLNITQNLTVSAWIYSTTWTQSRYVVNKGSGQGTSTSLQYALRDNNSNNLIFENTQTVATVGIPVPDSLQWNLVHATYGGGSARIYRNGVQISSANNANNLSTTTHELAIGFRSNVRTDASRANWMFNGSIDEVRVQKTLRDSNYIKLEFENQKATQTLVQAVAVVSPPSNLVYPTQSATYPVGTAITANVPTVTGTVDSFTVAPALPAGLVFSKTNGTISGTPSAAAVATPYVVTAVNAGGSAKDTVTLTVTDITGIRGGSLAGLGALSMKTMSSGMAFRVPGVEAASRVSARLSLTDMSGRVVWSGAFAAGMDNLAWNGTDNSGNAVPAGTYLARVTVKDASGAVRTLDARVPYTR